MAIFLVGYSKYYTYKNVKIVVNNNGTIEGYRTVHPGAIVTLVIPSSAINSLGENIKEDGTFCFNIIPALDKMHISSKQQAISMMGSLCCLDNLNKEGVITIKGTVPPLSADYLPQHTIDIFLVKNIVITLPEQFPSSSSSIINNNQKEDLFSHFKGKTFPLLIKRISIFKVE
jgi:hypothetical protein